MPEKLNPFPYCKTAFRLIFKHMRLSDEAIQEFKEIHYRQFREEISDDQAREMAERFMNFMEIICRPIPGVDFSIPEKEKKHPQKIVSFDKDNRENKMKE